VLAAITLVNDFHVGVPVTAALCVIAAYIVGSDAAIRLVRALNT